MVSLSRVETLEIPSIHVNMSFETIVYIVIFKIAIQSMKNKPFFTFWPDEGLVYCFLSL